MTLVRPEWLLVSDIDNTLTGDDTALEKLMRVLETNRDRIAFGVASGRSLELVEDAVQEYGLLEPSLIISSVGSEIDGEGDVGERYETHVGAGWERERVVETLGNLEGLTFQDEIGQRPYKVSFNTTSDVMPRVEAAIRAAGMNVALIHSHGEFLDVLPERAAKGKAVRFVAEAYGLTLEKIIVAGDSGNDADLLTCGAKAVVVGNYSTELEPVLHDKNIYVAKAFYAAGVLEGLGHYGVITSSQVTRA